jgi:alkaline phosphatase
VVFGPDQRRTDLAVSKLTKLWERSSLEFRAERRAKNVILFLGDGGGVPTLNAASIYGYNQPRKLFLQNMTHIALFSAVEKQRPTNDIESVRLKNVRRDDDHTGEEVLVAARGPCAERVRGFLSNTDLFHIMLAAWGWKDFTSR